MENAFINLNATIELRDKMIDTILCSYKNKSDHFYYSNEEKLRHWSFKKLKNRYEKLKTVNG